jgi:serine/threonine protein kinase
VTPGTAAYEQPTFVGPVRVDPDKPLSRGDVVGRYVVVAQIGRGGMGVVYSAYDPELDRKVAIKILLGSSGETSTVADARTRLVREAQALAQLSHPAVRRDPRRRDLRRPRVARHGIHRRRDPRRVAQAAHTPLARGPGDVQPAPVKASPPPTPPAWSTATSSPTTSWSATTGASASWTSASPRAEPRHHRAPVDLRASQSALRSSVTQDGMVMGTPQYMAPEQWLGDPTDARTDQFSFCVVPQGKPRGSI